MNSRKDRPILKKWLYYSLLSLLLLGGSIVASVFVDNNEKIESLVSLLITICATIYGFTITGYIYISDRLAKDLNDDPDIEEIISALRHSYRINMFFISVIVVFAFTSCFCSLVIGCTENIATYISLTSSFFLSGLSVYLIIKYSLALGAVIRHVKTVFSRENRSIE